MDASQFAADLRGRIKAAQEAYDEAEREEDFYAMDVRSGELRSLRRLATENGVDLSDLPDHDRAGGPDSPGSTEGPDQNGPSSAADE